MKVLNRFILALLVAILTASCALYPPSDPVAAADYYYTRYEDRINPNNVVAILSYASATVYDQYYFESVEEYTELLTGYYVWVETNGQIGSNYPTNATFEELRVAREFTGRWVEAMRKSGYTPSQIRSDFHDRVVKVIGRIQDREFKKYMREHGLVPGTR
jgi:hypothetical protein